MAWSLPDLMQAQAERSIASHSGTECGIGRGEFKSEARCHDRTLCLLEPFARGAERARTQRCRPWRDSGRAGRHVRARFRRPARLSISNRRLAGQRALPQGAPGLFVFGPVGSADREELDSILHCVADEAQAFLIGAEARLPNLDAANVEIVLMPLRHHGLTHARVLGGLAVHAAPAWMGLSGGGPIALTSLRALDPPARERLKPEDAARIDFSLREAPRRYKHLFVYSGDRPAI
jgi:hypothetical protein